MDDSAEIVPAGAATVTWLGDRTVWFAVLFVGGKAEGLVVHSSRHSWGFHYAVVEALL